MEKYLTSEQVAAVLQVHPFTVLKYLKSGTLEGVKIGRVYRIKESDVEKFLNGSARSARSPGAAPAAQAAQEPRRASVIEPVTHEIKFQDDEEKSSPSYYQVL